MQISGKPATTFYAGETFQLPANIVHVETAGPRRCRHGRSLGPHPRECNSTSLCQTDPNHRPTQAAPPPIRDDCASVSGNTLVTQAVFNPDDAIPRGDSQPGATSTNDHHVVAVVNDVVRPGHCRVALRFVHPPYASRVNDLRSGHRQRGGFHPSRTRRTQDRGSHSRCRRSHPYGRLGARRRTPHASPRDSSAT